MSSPADPETSRLILEPIGYVRNELATKVEAARQPRAAGGAGARIELLPGRHFEHALEDLARWPYIWVIFWFHHNAGWRPKVLPPRSTTGRKGVFSTRSPHRPNPLGMSVVRLERIEGLTLHILDADMLDGTPVLDLKPYVAYTDALPDAGSGWLDDAGPADAAASLGASTAAPARPADPVNTYVVTFEPPAAEQASWIETRTGLALEERIHSTLMLGPEPHPYRRIKPIDGGMQLAVKEWRIRFTVNARDVRVLEIRSGYRASQLASAASGSRNADDSPDGRREGQRGAEELLQAHREFNERWPPMRSSANS